MVEFVMMTVPLQLFDELFFLQEILKPVLAWSLERVIVASLKIRVPSPGLLPRPTISQPAFQLNFGALPYRYGQSMFMGGDTTALRTHLYTLDTSSFDRRLKETIDYYTTYYGKKR